jgi:hypothetical protein
MGNRFVLHQQIGDRTLEIFGSQVNPIVEKSQVQTDIKFGCRFPCQVRVT